MRGGCCRSLCTSSPPLPALTVGSRRWPGVVQLQPCALGIASIALPGKETQPQCGLEGLCEGSNCSRAAGVGIVRSGCVSCRRMLMRLQKCSSKSSGLPASCLHSYPGENERFLGPIPIIFSFFLWFIGVSTCWPKAVGEGCVPGAPWLLQQLSLSLQGTLKIITHLKAYFWLGETLFLPETFQRTEKPRRR